MSSTPPAGAPVTDPAHPADPADPARTAEPRAGWFTVLRRAFKQMGAHGITDKAAALTYFGVLAIFPAVLVLVSLLGLMGPDTAQNFLSSVGKIAPEGLTSFLSTIVDTVQGKATAASVAAIVGVLIALWSASGYVTAFMRSANAVYGVREGRPFWKTIPVRLLTTLAVVVLLIACVVILVVSGPIAGEVGRVIGAGAALQWVWAIAKVPTLIILVALLFSLLYGATPNVRYGRLRILTRGGLLAVVIWLVASALFGVYVAFSGSYNKTYGPVATAIIFLVWLWISNIAILLGLEFDAETLRERAIRSGAPADLEPFVRVRDTRKLKERDRQRAEAAAAILRRTAGAGMAGIGRTSVTTEPRGAATEPVLTTPAGHGVAAAAVGPAEWVGAAASPGVDDAAAKPEPAAEQALPGEALESRDVKRSDD